MDLRHGENLGGGRNPSAKLIFEMWECDTKKGFFVSPLDYNMNNIHQCQMQSVFLRVTLDFK